MKWIRNCKHYHLEWFKSDHFSQLSNFQSLSISRSHLKSLLNCVPCVLKTCSRADVPCVLTCSAVNVPCVLRFSRADVPSVLKWSRANVPCVLTCSHANVPCVLRCSRADVPCVLAYSRAKVLVLMPLLLKLYTLFVRSKSLKTVFPQ